MERWITRDRTPHRKTAIAAAALLKEDPAYLWPDFGRRVVSDDTHGEVITVYTERSSVPNSLWLSLLRTATESLNILVYAGPHLPEANPAWPQEIQKKCEESVKVRLAFGEPESPQVRARGDEEGVGDDLAARINYALRGIARLSGCPHLSICVSFHVPAFRAPIIHLRRIEDGPLFDTYVECFERIWARCRPLDLEG